MSKFIITFENQGQRLDKFLTKKLLQSSRSQIQKMIKNGEVLVKGKIVTPHYFLKIGDEIKIQTTENKALRLSLGQAQKTEKIKNLKLEIENFIIFENENFIMINKPSGLAVHPAPGIKEPTLVDYLLEKYPEIAKVGEDHSRPGIVHRLDKDISGLMIITKTQKAFEHLKKQFQERKIKKEYLALVYGKIEKNEGTIDFPIGRTKTGKMAARSKDTKEGKKAITEFEVIKRYKNFTLLKIRIKTGRTHQIRVHLFAYGHPIVGDKLYVSKKFKSTKLNRPFLHSSILGFLNLDNQWMEFKSDLPKELEGFLNTIH